MMRAAAEVDAAHAVDGEREDVVDVALHDPLEPVLDPEHLDALEDARMVAAPITLLMPGAGPPPTRIASFLRSLMVRRTL